MLSNLGLSKYEKNLRRGLLEDATIALWDARSLAEVGGRWVGARAAAEGSGAGGLRASVSACVKKVSLWRNEGGDLLLFISSVLTPSSPHTHPALPCGQVKIPPGPRLLILDHIDQYRHILRPAMPIPGTSSGSSLAGQ